MRWLRLLSIRSQNQNIDLAIELVVDLRMPTVNQRGKWQDAASSIDRIGFCIRRQTCWQEGSCKSLRKHERRSKEYDSLVRSGLSALYIKGGSLKINFLKGKLTWQLPYPAMGGAKPPRLQQFCSEIWRTRSKQLTVKAHWRSRKKHGPPGKGDTMHHPTRGAVTAKSAGTAVTIQNNTEGEIQVVVDRHYEYPSDGRSC